jgi:hypothetical protein
MKKLFKTTCMAALAALASCAPRTTAGVEVPFEIAKNYFFNNRQQIPANLKITSEEEFNRLFGMAAFMGSDGKPTEIDFGQKFVLAVVMPVTNVATEIHPQKVEAKGDTLRYSYEVVTSDTMTYSIQPASIIIVDREYADKVVVPLSSTRSSR